MFALYLFSINYRFWSATFFGAKHLTSYATFLLNHCRFPDYALSIKTRAVSAIHGLQEKINCQLGHLFSAATVYIAKL